MEGHFLRRTQKFLRGSLLLAVSMPKSPQPKDKIGDANFCSTCIKTSTRLTAKWVKLLVLRKRLLVCFTEFSFCDIILIGRIYLNVAEVKNAEESKQN